MSQSASAFLQIRPLRRNHLLALFCLLGCFFFLPACASEKKLVVNKVTIKPADAVVSLGDTYIEYRALATYDDGSKGDVTSSMIWQSFPTFQTDSTTDLLFQNQTSPLAVLRTTGKYTILATWLGYYDATTDLRAVTTLTVE